MPRPIVLQLLVTALFIFGFGWFIGTTAERISWHKERDYLLARALDKGVNLLERHKKCEAD